MPVLGKHIKKKVYWLDRVPRKAARLAKGHESTANEKKIKET